MENENLNQDQEQQNIGGDQEQQNSGGAGNGDGERTFTQAEVDKLIEKRLARERKNQPSEQELAAYLQDANQISVS